MAAPLIPPTPSVPTSGWGPNGEPVLRVAHLVNDLSLGGVQVWATTVLKHLGRLGCEVFLFFREYNPTEGSMALYNGLSLYPVESDAQLREYVDAFQIDVLHGHSCGGGADAVRLARECGITGGETIHSCVPGERQGDFEVVHTDHVRAMRPGSTVIRWGIDPARLLQTHYQGGAPNHPGARLRAELGIPQDAFVIARNGRLDGSKLPDHFVEALAQGETDVHGILSGYGSMEDKLKELARMRGVSDRLHFWRPGIWPGDVFAAADAVVYPTWDESFCAGAVEPMLYGLPVIAYRRGGMGEYLEHMRTGLVAENVAGLVHWIRFLRAQPEVASFLGQAGKKRVNALGLGDPLRDAAEHLALYQSCRPS